MIFVCISRGVFFPQLSQCIFTSGTRAVSGGNNTFSVQQRFPRPLLAQPGRGGRAAQESGMRSVPAPITDAPPRCPATRAASAGLIPAARGDPYRVLHHRCHRALAPCCSRSQGHPCPLHSPSQPQQPTGCAHTPTDHPTRTSPRERAGTSQQGRGFVKRCLEGCLLTLEV